MESHYLFQLALRRLPRIEPGARVIVRRVHLRIVIVAPGREFDYVAVRVAKVDGFDDVMIGNAAALYPRCPALCQHRFKLVARNFESDVQIKIVLLLEVERLSGYLEEGEIRTVIQPVESVQRLDRTSCLGFADLERGRERQSQEILVELACFRGIPAAPGVVVEAFDHMRCPLSRWRKASALPAKLEYIPTTAQRVSGANEQ